jgi:hypothetical protein
MKLLIISSAAAFGLVAGVSGISGIHQSRSPSTPVERAAMPTMQELHIAAGVDKLAVAGFEDLSLVFPREAKQ